VLPKSTDTDVGAYIPHWRREARWQPKKKERHMYDKRVVNELFAL
jgi:hypothetical protein